MLQELETKAGELFRPNLSQQAKNNLINKFKLLRLLLNLAYFDFANIRVLLPHVLNDCGLLLHGLMNLFRWLLKFEDINNFNKTHIATWSIPVVRAIRFEFQPAVVQFGGYDQEVFSVIKNSPNKSLMIEAKICCC